MCYPADQLKEFKRQLEKERAISREEVDKELNNVKLEVESKKHALELRHAQVESVVAEVLLIFQLFHWFMLCFVD